MPFKKGENGEETKSPVLSDFTMHLSRTRSGSHTCPLGSRPHPPMKEGLCSQKVYQPVECGAVQKSPSIFHGTFCPFQSKQK